ncbi:MAG TPA: hypothetical protein VMV93_00730 [Chloroflexota bacterium]|nr:hypothetical protein [Chloroflexota bacterium]
MAEAGLVAGAQLAGLRASTKLGWAARGALALSGGTLLLGALLWTAHDVAHRRWRSLAGGLVGVVASAGELILLRPAADSWRGRSLLSRLAAVAVLAGAAHSAQYPELR